MESQYILRRKDVLAWFFVAVFVRIGLLALVDTPNDKGDVIWYVRLATNLIEHQVFSLDAVAPFSPTIYRPPLYPALLAIPWLATGVSIMVAQFIQVVVGAATVILLALGVDVAVSRSRAMGRGSCDTLANTWRLLRLLVAGGLVLFLFGWGYGCALAASRMAWIRWSRCGSRDGMSDPRCFLGGNSLDCNRTGYSVDSAESLNRCLQATSPE